jgi:predicted Fe-Mo cluster-binding NifX family protein
MVRVAVPTSRGGLDDRVHESLVRADTFTLMDTEEGRVNDVEVLENPHKNESYGAGSKVALFLVNRGVNVLLTPMDCPKGKAILDAGGVKIIKVKGGEKVRNVLNLVMD